MSDPLSTPHEGFPALERVLEYASGYLADLDGPVRPPTSDAAACAFPADFPEAGCGTQAGSA